MIRYKYWIVENEPCKLVMQTWLTHPDRKLSEDILITGTLDEINNYWVNYLHGDPPKPGLVVIME